MTITTPTRICTDSQDFSNYVLSQISGYAADGVDAGQAPKQTANCQIAIIDFGHPIGCINVHAAKGEPCPDDFAGIMDGAAIWPNFIALSGESAKCCDCDNFEYVFYAFDFSHLDGSKRLKVADVLIDGIKFGGRIGDDGELEVADPELRHISAPSNNMEWKEYNNIMQFRWLKTLVAKYNIFHGHSSPAPKGFGSKRS